MERNQLRQPDPEKKVALRGKEALGRDPGLNTPRNKAEMRVKTSPENLQEENSKPSGETRRPVTNHDEQRNIVNGDSNDPMGEKETEGD